MPTGRPPRLAVLSLLTIFTLVPFIAVNAEDPPEPALPAAPANLEFEEGETGAVPAGWLSPVEGKGYTVRITEDRPHRGERCALITHQEGGGEGTFGNLMQTFDATPYRGKRIRYRAFVRTETEGMMDRVQLWMRVDVPQRGTGFFDNMGDRPIRTGEWREFEIVGTVAGNAEDINIGVMLIGRGKAWIDAVTFEVLGEIVEDYEEARPLEGRALDNLVAFTRLLGYVRYFHPTEEVEAADWDLLTIEGVRNAESAKDPPVLAARLQALFRDVAPTVRVFPTGELPDLPEALLSPSDDSAHRVVWWRHLGVGTGSPQSIYRSVLEKTSDPSLRPDEPFEADLGGGVSCLVPMVLYVDRTPVAPDTAGATPVEPRPEGWIPSGKDRATRLAGVALAWNVFQHFYPYFDVVETDWPGALRTALQQAATDEDEEAYLHTLRVLVAGIHDGHGRVFAGGGMARMGLPVLWEWIEDKLVITEVAPEFSGQVSRGNVVMKYRDRHVAVVLAEREAEISSATEQWRRYRSVSELRYCEPDAGVTLQVLTPGVELQEMTLPCSTPLWGEGALVEDRPDSPSEIAEGIWYLDVGRTDDASFTAAVEKLAGAKGIVMDLRGYPGFNFSELISHLISEPVTCARWNVPKPHRPDRQGTEFQFSSWTVPPKEPRFTENVAFLTDGRAISAAETLLGIIEHYKLAEIVGGPTAGTNGNVNPFTLPGGYRVMWTGMKVLKHDGSRHHGIGILPTIPAARTIPGVAAGRDEVLERAVKHLQEAIPDSP